MRQALILFTRIPVPGKTKTRLMPYFSPKQCAQLHTCFLKDISEQCRNTMDKDTKGRPRNGLLTTNKG